MATKKKTDEELAEGTQETADSVQEPAEGAQEAAEPGEELVDYTAPLMPRGSSQDVFVSVNGETVRFKRGVSVKLKRKFVEVLEHANAQEMAAYGYMSSAQQAGTRAAAAM